MFKAFQLSRYCRPHLLRGPCTRKGFKSSAVSASRDLYPRRNDNLWDWHGPSSPFKAFDENFRNFMNQFERAILPRFFDDYGRPSLFKTAEANVKVTEKEYEVLVDVRNFNPENIKIKVTNERLIISGKHEQKADEHGHVSREFTREFSLPETVDIESMCSGVTDAGILYVRAKMKGAEESDKSREVKIDIEKEA